MAKNKSKQNVATMSVDKIQAELKSATGKRKVMLLNELTKRGK